MDIRKIQNENLKMLYLGLKTLAYALDKSKEFKSIEKGTEWIVFNEDYTFLYKDLRGLIENLKTRDFLGYEVYEMLLSMVLRMPELNDPYFDDDLFKGKLDIRKNWIAIFIENSKTLLGKEGIEEIQKAIKNEVG